MFLKKLLPTKTKQPPFISEISTNDMYKQQFHKEFYKYTDILENFIKEGYIMENDKMLYLKELIAELDNEEARLLNEDIDVALADEIARLKAEFVANRDAKVEEIRLAKKVYANRYAIEEKLYAEQLALANEPAENEENKLEGEV